MGLDHSSEASFQNKALFRSSDKEEYPFPPWQFQHQDIIRTLESAETIDRESLINILNRIHFMDGHILVRLNHSIYEESILVRAFPRPCHGTTVTGILSKRNIVGLDLENYRLTHLIIDDGRIMIVVPVELQEVNRNIFSIQIPTQGYITGRRKARRYACKDIIVEMIQNGFRVRGDLLDFNPYGFRIKVHPESTASFHWFNSDASVIIQLQNHHQIFFSGTCQYIRQTGKLRNREIVLAPLDETINRFKKKRSRNLRQTLVPPPTLFFEHPLLRKNAQFEVYNISPSGLAIHENTNEQLLLPGMIIPSLVLRLTGGLEIRCNAQVIYCMKEEKGIRCGLALLDMDVNAYSRLTQVLANAVEDDAYITSEADMDALWEFFFDTGFIYPKKYSLIQSNKEILKETYQKIYQNNPEIAKQFIYQINGKVYGYISMIRAYDRSWMMHHYAAKVVERKRKGLAVMQQIIHYLNDMQHLPSANMDYLMCYFRPENKFPERVFGGFAKALGDLQGCSMDLFAYISYPALSLGIRLPQGWWLRECSPHDLWQLNRFYGHFSGGLLLDTLSLEKDDSNDESLEEVYKRLGFLRKWNAYSLTHNGELHAVLIVNQSNLGINFSELLRSITIIVTNAEGMLWSVLSTAVAQLTGVYQSDRIPILIYPFDYVKVNTIPYEKRYQLWIMSVQYGNEWMDYMENRFRIVSH